MSHKIITAVKLKVKRQIIFSSKFYFHISSKKQSNHQKPFLKMFFLFERPIFFLRLSLWCKLASILLKKSTFTFSQRYPACCCWPGWHERERVKEKVWEREKERKREWERKREDLKIVLTPAAPTQVSHMCLRARAWAPSAARASRWHRARHRYITVQRRRMALVNGKRRHINNFCLLPRFTLHFLPSLCIEKSLVWMLKIQRS